MWMKDFFLSWNFFWWHTLIFYVHATFSMPLHIETFLGKLVSGIFCNSENTFFGVTELLLKYFLLYFCKKNLVESYFNKWSKKCQKRLKILAFWAHSPSSVRVKLKCLLESVPWCLVGVCGNGPLVSSLFHQFNIVT